MAEQTDTTQADAATPDASGATAVLPEAQPADTGAAPDRRALDRGDDRQAAREDP